MTIKSKYVLKGFPNHQNQKAQTGEAVGVTFIDGRFANVLLTRLLSSFIREHVDLN